MNRVASNSPVSARLFTTIFVFLVFGSACISTRRDAPDAKSPANQSAQTESQRSSPVQPKILAEGFDSSIKYPFVAVLRDMKTYDTLREQDSKLPKLDESFFKSNFIIAAFLSERSTGGFTIAITSENDGFTIKEQKPEKDAMVSQIITAPFKLVAIPARPDELVRIVLDDAWKSELKLYRVSGWFKSSEGAAGTVVNLQLRGTIRWVHTVGLVTFFFAVPETGRDAGPVRGLYGTFTGTVKDGRELRIRKMSTAGLIQLPYDGAQAEGVLGQDRSELGLKFTSLPSRISNGYRGEGFISGLQDFNYEGRKDSH